MRRIVTCVSGEGQSAARYSARQQKPSDLHKSTWNHNDHDEPRRFCPDRHNTIPLSTVPLPERRFSFGSERSSTTQQLHDRSGRSYTASPNGVQVSRFGILKAIAVEDPLPFGQPMRNSTRIRTPVTTLRSSVSLPGSRWGLLIRSASRRSPGLSRAICTSWRMQSVTKLLCASRSGGGCLRMRCRRSARRMMSGVASWATGHVAHGSRSALESSRWWNRRRGIAEEGRSVDAKKLTIPLAQLSFHQISFGEISNRQSVIRAEFACDYILPRARACTTPEASWSSRNAALPPPPRCLTWSIALARRQPRILESHVWTLFRACRS